VGKKVRIITANEVIHAGWVPAFGIIPVSAAMSVGLNPVLLKA